MAFDPEELAEAQAIQANAASDPSDQVRLIAGPGTGTGKSKNIEERVCWLLAQGVDPERIAAVSFTRASAQDLELRVARDADRPHQLRKVVHDDDVRAGVRRRGEP